MSGHMGAARVTAKFEIIRVDAERNLIMVKGAVPAPAETFTACC